MNDYLTYNFPTFIAPRQCSENGTSKTSSSSTSSSSAPLASQETAANSTSPLPSPSSSNLEQNKIFIHCIANVQQRPEISSETFDLNSIAMISPDLIVSQKHLLLAVSLACKGLYDAGCNPNGRALDLHRGVCKHASGTNSMEKSLESFTLNWEQGDGR